MNMLSYFRYLSVIVFLLVLAAAFFAGLFFRIYTTNSLIVAPTLQLNEDVRHNYMASVWCRYMPVFVKMENIGQDNNQVKAKNELFEGFIRNSKALLSITPNIKVSLYYENGKQIFSNNDRGIVFFNSKDEPGNEFMVNINRFVKAMGYYEDASPDNMVEVSAVFTRNVIDGGRCANLDKIQTTRYPVMSLEIIYDVSTASKSLVNFHIIITTGIIVVFIMLYLALYFTSRKTEKIINKQHEENLALTEAKAAAEAQNKEKSMFLANVSHELRTPLNAIIGFSEIIKDEVMGPINNEQYKEYVTDINASGVHLLSLINDILDYSKAEAKKLDVEAIDVDLSKLAENSMRLVEPRAREAKVNLDLQLPEKHVVLTADPKRLKQVVLNLLSNSVKFTPENGTVSLQIKPFHLENRVDIIVRDTGIGIAPKDISKALSPFGQVDSALSRRYEGTGLGLPLTKKLTEIMGGEFDIKSKEGAGTIVILRFPLTQVKKEKGKEGQF